MPYGRMKHVELHPAVMECHFHITGAVRNMQLLYITVYLPYNILCHIIFLLLNDAAGYTPADLLEEQKHV